MKPDKVLRIGAVSASVFAHEIGSDNEKRQLRNVNLQRRYRDNESGEWKSATSFGLSDLPAAIKVLEMALDYIASLEADLVS